MTNMMILGVLELPVFIGLYLLIGYIVYRWHWPRGFVQLEQDAHRERLLRTGRRRILPLPRGRGGER